jgi:hypothetical protein
MDEKTEAVRKVASVSVIAQTPKNPPLRDTHRSEITFSTGCFFSPPPSPFASHETGAR